MGGQVSELFPLRTKGRAVEEKFAIKLGGSKIFQLSCRGSQIAVDSFVMLVLA